MSSLRSLLSDRESEARRFDLPDGWSVVSTQHYGPFLTHAVFRRPDGSEVRWNSRASRVGASLPHRPGRSLDAVPSLRRRLVGAARRPAYWTAISYLLASLILAAGASARLLGLLPTVPDDAVYLTASLLFLVGSYAQFVGALNPNPPGRCDDPQRRWSWVGWRPHELGFLLACGFLVGSLLFTSRSGLQLLSAVTLPITGPALVAGGIGCGLFTFSSLIEVRETGRSAAGHRSTWWDPQSMFWWRAALSFVGCLGFSLGVAARAFPALLPIPSSTASQALFLAGTVPFFANALLMFPEARRALG